VTKLYNEEMQVITPKTINKPDDTINRIAAVVTTSSPRFSIVTAPRMRRAGRLRWRHRNC